MATRPDFPKSQCHYNYDEKTKLVVTTTTKKDELHPQGYGHVLFNSIKEHKGKIVQLDIETGLTETYDELYIKSIRTAIELRKMGVKPGDLVTIYAENEVSQGAVFVAIGLVGAVNTSLDPILSLSDCEDLLKQIVPKVVFVSRSCEENIEKLTKKLGMSPKVVVFGETKRNIEFSKFLEPKKGEEDFEPYVCKDLDEICFIKFSSGTTGLAKGICWNHKFVIQNTTMLFPVKWLIYANLHWIGSATGFMQTIRSGGTRATAKEFNAQTVWKKIEEHQINYLTLSPYLSIKFAESKPEGHLSSLMCMGITGSGISDEYMMKVRKALPKTIVYMPFGQTETGALFDCLQETPLKKPQSVGLPLPHVIYKIVDPETEEKLGFNQKGELRVKSDKFCSGYYNRDSSEIWDSEGFLRTGDIFYFDEDFCFFCVDRIKEVFKYRNYNIQPAKYEAILMNHPEVDLCVISGVPNAIDSHHVCAGVVLKPKAKITPAKLEKYYNDKVNEECRIRAGVHFLESMPLTPSGKINRSHVKATLLEILKNAK